MKIIFLDFNGTIDKPYTPPVYAPMDYKSKGGKEHDEHFPPLGEGEEVIYQGRQYHQDMTQAEFEALIDESLEGTPKREKSIGEMTDAEFEQFMKRQFAGRGEFHELTSAQKNQRILDEINEGELDEYYQKKELEERQAGLAHKQLQDWYDTKEWVEKTDAQGNKYWVEQDKVKKSNVPQIGQETSWLSKKHAQEMKDEKEEEGYQPSFPGINYRKGRSSYGRGYDYYSKGGSILGDSKPYHYGAYEECVKYLRQLIEETGAKIVYSTTQRYGGWKSCADYVGLPYEMSLGQTDFVGGVTPSLPVNVPESRIVWYKNIPFFRKKEEPSPTYWKPRQKEIQEWFKRWKGEKIESFVILDDEIITDPKLVPHWVSSVKDNRFLEKEYKEALKILKKKK